MPILILCEISEGYQRTGKSKENIATVMHRTLSKYSRLFRTRKNGEPSDFDDLWKSQDF